MQDSSSRLKPERHGDDNPIINDELVSLAWNLPEGERW